MIRVKENVNDDDSINDEKNLYDFVLYDCNDSDSDVDNIYIYIYIYMSVMLIITQLQTIALIVICSVLLLVRKD